MMARSPQQLSFLRQTFSVEGVHSGLRGLWSDRRARAGIRLLFVLWAVIGGAAWIIERRVPPWIPIHYARPWGEMQFAPRESLWWLAGAAVGLGIVNVVLSAILSSNFRILSRLVIWGTLLLTTLAILVLWTVWARVGI